MTDETLSEYLLPYAEEIQERLKLGDRYVSDEQQELLQEAVRSLLEGRQALQEADLSGIESILAGADPKFLRREFDREYTLQILREVPRVVERTLRLSTLVASKRAPTRRLQTYLQQATRCYLFGLSAASVALSRAAVEHALREQLTGITERSSHKLSDMIEGARRFGILDAAKSGMATQVKLIGDKVLHGGALTDGEAWDALVAARGLLEEMHS
jgi:hypothetical protein